MYRNNCIEVRLIEQEDVKQGQYWEFINEPHFLHLINYSLPKISTIQNMTELKFSSCLFTSVPVPQSCLFPETQHKKKLKKKKKCLNE